ncbi:MAG: hypothetical protein IJG42_10955 [Muribaculaceae bacterium]|nr:hypothetical protein [Muribaculaceae bacterium]
MIKVGIVGCDHLRAAELVRVLINHPDVELMWVTGSCDAGTRLDSIVPGIIGECNLTISAQASLDDVDVVFVCGSRAQVSALLPTLVLPENVKVIDLSGSHNMDHGEDKVWKYGLGEMQRRLLVHDARLVTVPGNVATASLLALMPMARNLMLNSPITLHVGMGAMAFPDQGKTLDGLNSVEWAHDQQREVALALTQCQSSFGQPVDLTISPIAECRILAVAARFKCGVDEETIRQLYEQYYEDHNFVFLVDKPIIGADVANTNKCIIRLEKDEHSGELTVHAVIDLLLKGNAGNAVHMMNLLFGLHERVGLALKGSGY